MIPFNSLIINVISHVLSWLSGIYDSKYGGFGSLPQSFLDQLRFSRCFLGPKKLKEIGKLHEVNEALKKVLF